MSDATVADRLQFTLTVMFHYLFPITTMGLAPLIVLLSTLYLVRREQRHARAARFWARIFGINFAAGVVTGVPMEFQFGTNWASFSAFSGGVIGQTLAMEGIFAFFLEAGFLGVFLWGANRVPPVVHWLSAVLLALGAMISAFFITVTDAWMQHPVGYRVVNGRAELTSIGALLTNPFGWWQFLHVIVGALLTASCLLAAVGAFYLLRGRHGEFARMSVGLGVALGAAFAVLQVFPTGDMNARNVSTYQPVKGAAYEGLFRSQAGAPIAIIGMPSTEQRRLIDPVEVPGALSFLTYGDVHRPVPGLDSFPEAQWPPVQITYYAYHIMVGLGTIFLAVLGLGALLLWRRRLFTTRWYLWTVMLMLPFPYIANEAGWVVTEVGRQPWLIWGVMPTARGASPTVEAGETIFTLLGFAGTYTVLGLGFLFLVGRQIALGPRPLPAPAPVERSAL
jgi:cytochrome d ubiquinol oxidase subunit I